MSITDARRLPDASLTMDLSARKIDRDGYTEFQENVTAAAEAKAQSRQHDKGKNTARERIDLLLDADTFVEIGQFVGGNVSEGFTGAAVVCGYGNIDGRPVAVYAQDFTVRGGTLGEAEGDKIIATIDKALELKIPVIGLLDSGGARIQEGVASLGGYAEVFQRNVMASGVIPQISMIMGPCAGGAVYSPALTDFIIMTKDNSHMFVTGPEVVRATTGEDVSFADLGGAEVHNFQSGVAHYLAEDEEDALDYTRTLLTYLPSNCDAPTPRYAFDGEVNCADLGAIVPESSKHPYDMTEVIAEIVDHGEFVQIQENFARSIVIGFACVDGESVGIVANQPLFEAGTLDVDASEKAARFVQFCDAFNIPIVTLVDVPGYRPGAEQEQAGIIRRGAKLIWAYATASVPLVTVILRKAYGGAYIVMGSKKLGADINLAWPTAQVAVMGSGGAVNILQRRALAKVAEAGGDVEAERARLVADYEEELINPWEAARRGFVDDVVAPSETRVRVVQALRALRTKRAAGPAKKHGNIPL